jgi:hypothetical protein
MRALAGLRPCRSCQLQHPLRPRVALLPMREVHLRQSETKHDGVMPADPKDVLKSYLQGARDTLIRKLDGLSERDQRLPRTPTGMNLLGIVKHALNT